MNVESALEYWEWTAGIVLIAFPVLMSAAVVFINRHNFSRPLLFVLTATAITIGGQSLFGIIVIPLALSLVTGAIKSIAHFDLQMTPPFSWAVQAILWRYWSLTALVLLPIAGLLWSTWLSLSLGKRWPKIVPALSPAPVGK